MPVRLKFRSYPGKFPISREIAADSAQFAVEGRGLILNSQGVARGRVKRSDSAQSERCNSAFVSRINEHLVSVGAPLSGG